MALKTSITFYLITFILPIILFRPLFVATKSDMKRIVSVTIIRILLMFVFVRPAYSFDTAGASAQLLLQCKVADPRVSVLEDYLKSHNSPLAPYASHFIERADFYGLQDWRLVPAITGVESTFGKAIPKNSYNAYGWANGAYSFNSWEESIDVVTKSLKTKYIDRGANTIEKIGRIYAPPSHTWAGKVHFFMDKISEFDLSEDSLAFTL